MKLSSVFTWSISVMFLGTFIVGAGAADTPGAFTDQDVPVYLKLRYARIMAEQKGMFAHSDAQRKALEAEVTKAIEDAKWTRERYDQVNDAVGQILPALAALEKGGDEAKDAQSTLADMDKTIVATVKAHRKELDTAQEQRKQADQQIRDEAAAKRRGEAPDPAKLAGMWVFDMDATIEAIVPNSDAEMTKKMRASLEKSMSAASYTFGPGDAMVATIERTDASGQKSTSTDKGTYRVEGSTLFIKSGGNRREMQMEVGMKGENLLIGMQGIYSVFRRKG